MADEDAVNDILGLLHRASSGMTGLAQQMADASHSHPTDLAAISLLARRPGQVSVGELGAELGLSKAATTNLVDRLEAAGHVRRVRDARDRRRWHLDVTDAAHDLAESVLRDFLSRTRAALSSYDEAELAVVRRFLTDVAGALERRDPVREATPTVGDGR